MTEAIRAFEGREEFVGPSMEATSDLDFLGVAEESEGLLPVVVHFSDSLPDVHELLSMLWHVDADWKNEVVGDDVLSETSSKEPDEHFRLLPHIGVLIGKLTPVSLTTLLDSTLVRSFSWDIRKLEYHRKITVDKTKGELHG